MDKFSPKKLEPRQSVVVLGGGPSLMESLPKVRNWMDEDTVVFTPNYEHDIPPDYVVYTDRKKFDETIGIVKCPNIIVCRTIAENMPRKRYNKTYFMINTVPSRENIYRSNSIRIRKGKICHSTSGNAGFSSILLSTFFNPSRLLLVGFDGFAPNMLEQHKFDGSVRTTRFPNRSKMKTRYFRDKLVPYLVNRNIELFCYPETVLWGLDKNNFTVIK